MCGPLRVNVFSLMHEFTINWTEIKNKDKKVAANCLAVYATGNNLLYLILFLSLKLKVC